jgi:hypothetical protein
MPSNPSSISCYLFFGIDLAETKALLIAFADIIAFN